MWIFYAALASATAALVTIFGKIGLKGVDATLATTLRAIVMAILMILASAALGKFRGVHAADFTGKDWLFIVLAGLAGAASWLFYFLALKTGDASKVAAIDRTSLVVIVACGALFFGEALTWRSGAGALLVALGAAMIAWK